MMTVITSRYCLFKDTIRKHRQTDTGRDEEDLSSHSITDPKPRVNDDVVPCNIVTVQLLVQFPGIQLEDVGRIVALVL